MMTTEEKGMYAKSRICSVYVITWRVACPGQWKKFQQKAWPTTFYVARNKCHFEYGTLIKLYKGGSTTVIRLNQEPINIVYCYSQTSHMTGPFAGGSKGASMA